MSTPAPDPAPRLPERTPIPRDDAREQWAALIREIAFSRMPFGKFGPQAFPPRGVPLYDLPYEYLAWFARQGFPEGRLGELLRFLYQLKQDGAEGVFEPFRRAAGGRTDLRRPRPQHRFPPQ